MVLFTTTFSYQIHSSFSYLSLEALSNDKKCTKSNVHSLNKTGQTD